MELKEKYQNGKIPKRALKEVDSGHLMEKNASDSYRRMKKDALKDGIELVLPYETSGYRPCGEKGDYIQRNCNTGFTQWCAWEKYKANVGNLAANPTTSKGCKSNHGWGIAIDVKGSDVKKWLRDNGEKYGWWWGEAPSEDWQFTYDFKKDTFLNENKNTLLYIILGLSVVGFSLTLYLATRKR